MTEFQIVKERCPLVGGCLFFNDKLAALPSTAELLKNRYCRGAFTECGRYIVREALGKDRVPLDLFPQNRQRADEIVLLEKLGKSK